MPQIVDQYGNPFVGSIDQVTGGTITDSRPITAALGALNAESVMDLYGYAVASFDLRSAAFTGTVVFEGTIDGVNYIGLPALNALTEQYTAAQAYAGAANSQFIVGVSGFRRIRIRVSAYTSGTLTVALRASVADYAIYARPFPATLHVTATAAVNTGSTATLAAAGAGLFHYIVRAELVKLYSVVGVAAGAGVIVTTTNLPGNPAFTTEQLASAAGTVARVIDFNPNQPLKSSVANTATTFVAPAQLQTIWRWNVTYYVGA